MNKIIGIGIAILAIGYYSKFVFDIGYNSAETDIEIYTRENIYYINDLTVTNESTDYVVTFSSKEALKEYISYISAHDNE